MGLQLHNHRHRHERGPLRALWHTHVHAHRSPAAAQPILAGHLERRPAADPHRHTHRGRRRRVA